MDIIDAHHHFWDLTRNYHPWLCDEKPIPFRYGDYSRIKRNYMPDDLRADAQDFRLINSVYVETEWDSTDPLGESRWVTQVHKEEGLPGAIVGQAWLDASDTDEILTAQADFELMRSIRHKPTGAATYEEFTQGKRSAMGERQWRRGYETLARLGLRFDLQTPFWHLPEAYQLATDLPDTLLIVNHTGLPADRSQVGLSQWQDAMAQLASAPNVRVKISGLGQRDQPWTVEANKQIVRYTINSFGVQRCMFASNFPVDSLCGDFSTIYSGFTEIVADYPLVDQQRLFVETAKEVYSI